MNESTSVPFGVKSQALFTVQRCIQLKEVGPIREVSTIICHPKKKREEGREGKRREEKGEKRQSLLRIDLLTMNSLSFVLSENIFISHQFLKGIFARYITLD